MRFNVIHWLVLALAVLMIVGGLCLIGGCAGSGLQTVETSKSTPVLIDKAKAASVRVGEGIVELKPLVKELPVAVSTVARMEVDNNEVQTDLGAAGKQADLDAIAKAKVDADLAKARSGDVKAITEKIIWLAVLFSFIAAGFTVATIFLPAVKGQALAGAISFGVFAAATFIFAGVFATIILAATWIIWVSAGLACIGAALWGWHLWTEHKSADALASAKADTASIAQGVKSAVALGEIELTKGAKEVFNLAQTQGAKDIVNEVQGRIPTPAVTP